MSTREGGAVGAKVDDAGNVREGSVALPSLVGMLLGTND